MQVMKQATKKSTLALKLIADITISPEQGYQWPHKKTDAFQKLKKQLVPNNMYLFPILPIPGGRMKIHTILVSTILLYTDNFN